MVRVNFLMGYIKGCWAKCIGRRKSFGVSALLIGAGDWLCIRVVSLGEAVHGLEAKKESCMLCI